MTLREQLQQIKNQIIDPVHWCQEWYATTQAGEHTTSHSPDAYQWCLLGAMAACGEHYANKNTPVLIHLADCARETLDLPPGIFPDLKHSSNNGALLTYVNDELGFDAVHQLLDTAIAQTAP